MPITRRWPAVPSRSAWPNSSRSSPLHGRRPDTRAAGPGELPGRPSAAVAVDSSLHLGTASRRRPAKWTCNAADHPDLLLLRVVSQERGGGVSYSTLHNAVASVRLRPENSDPIALSMPVTTVEQAAQRIGGLRGPDRERCGRAAARPPRSHRPFWRRHPSMVSDGSTPRSGRAQPPVTAGIRRHACRAGTSHPRSGWWQTRVS